MDMTIDETVEALVAKKVFWFGGGAPIERIHRAEERLGEKFPAAYTVWLLRYGGGGAKGAEISGVFQPADDLEPGSVMGDTLRLRESVALPAGMVAILCNEGQAPWCLHTDPAAGTCPVVSFDKGKITTLYPDFNAFFADYVVAWAQDIGRDLHKKGPLA